MNREEFTERASTFLGKEMSARDTEAFILALQSHPDLKAELLEMENTINTVHSLEDELQNVLPISTRQLQPDETNVSSLSSDHTIPVHSHQNFLSIKPFLAIAACISIAFISGWMLNSSHTENIDNVQLVDSTDNKSNADSTTKPILKKLASQTSHSHYSLANCLRVLSATTAK